MNGRPPGEFFTLAPVGGPAAMRLYAERQRLSIALIASVALHVVAALAPGLGVSASAMRFMMRGPESVEPARVLEVRFSSAVVPAPALAGRPAQGAAAAGAPQTRTTAERAEPASRLARGEGLLPVPAPAFYPADQLTRRPRPLSPPNLYIGSDFARYVVGKVVLRLWISAAGDVEAVEVVGGDLPKDVSDAAANAFRRSRFAPGELNGRRVGAVMQIEINYNDLRKLTR